MIVLAVLMIILGLGIFAGVLVGLWNTPEVMSIENAATGAICGGGLIGIGLAILFECLPLT